VALAWQFAAPVSATRNSRIDKREMVREAVVAVIARNGLLLRAQQEGSCAGSPTKVPLVPPHPNATISIGTWPVALRRRPSDTDVPPDLRLGSNRLLQPVSRVSSVSRVSPVSLVSRCPAGAIVSKARTAHEGEAILEALPMPVGASGAVPKGMVAVSEGSHPSDAPRPVQDPAHG